MGSFPRDRRAFTLVELIVVVGIMAVLMTMVAALVRGAKGTARVTECGHNLRQVWSALSGYAQDNGSALPPGGKNTDALSASTADVFRELLGGRIELLYCRTYPLRRDYLGGWEDAIANGTPAYAPRIGYLYLAGSIYEGWDVPNEQLADDFQGARRIDSVGHGVSYRGDTVWMADFARCSTSAASGRDTPGNWELTSHPPQRVRGKKEKVGRKDYRLPDGGNVLFEDGHVVFRPRKRLRPRLKWRGQVLYW